MFSINHILFSCPHAITPTLSINAPNPLLLITPLYYIQRRSYDICVITHILISSRTIFLHYFVKYQNCLRHNHLLHWYVIDFYPDLFFIVYSSSNKPSQCFYILLSLVSRTELTQKYFVFTSCILMNHFLKPSQMIPYRYDICGNYLC